MEHDTQEIIQQKVSQIPNFWVESLHRVRGVPKDFRPWTCELSPSALYNCSLPGRKKMGLKIPETKWMSIKRWVPVTPQGIILPTGIFLSIKRHEKYISDPKPRFVKTEFILLMFPFGNVWSQQAPGIPIDEPWMWSETDNMTMLEALVRKDARHPVIGYFKSSYDYMLANPDQIRIHLKRQKKE